MGNRLSRITTRTGDAGTTGLGDGARIHKSAPRVQAMGDIDEANSALGLVLAETLSSAARMRLTRVQNQMFDLGGEICIPGHRALTDAHVEYLEAAIAELNATLPPLQEFVLPGGTRAAAACHLARAVTRRAERSLAALASREEVSAHALRYLNRLSDLLFIQARCLNREAGHDEVVWAREPRT
jgi:cob(I)alamin adenosyltransferase